MTVPVCSRTVDVTAFCLAKASAAAFRHDGQGVSAGPGRVSGQKGPGMRIRASQRLLERGSAVRAAADTTVTGAFR